MSSHEERGGGSDTGSDGTTHVGSAGSNDLGVAASGHAGVWVARAGEMPPLTSGPRNTVMGEVRAWHWHMHPPSFKEI
jgi:hypothetical protein